jgi:DNA-binding CsgD family transcriptional regulator
MHGTKVQYGMVMEHAGSDAPAQGVASGAEERIDWVPIPAWVAGPDLVRRHFNSSWSQLAGRDAGQGRDERWLAGVHPEDRGGLQRAYAVLLQSPRSFQAEYRLRDASGEYRRLLEAGGPYYDRFRGLVGFAGVCLDVGDGERGPRAQVARQWDCLRTLTPREYQVFREIVVGRLNKQVAASLGITIKTVKVHRRHVMEKTGARSIAELVRLADRLGL